MKTQTEKLRDAFLYHRRKHLPGLSIARAALERAREDVANKKDRYPSSVAHGSTLGAAMSDGAQWGNPDLLGLRFAGWQDELRTRTRDSHTGWYIRHDDCDSEVYRGCVYQLPARDGCAIYIPAYREGNDTKKGWVDGSGEHSAALDFSNILRGTRGENTSRYDTADTLLDAARAADSLAENAAEKSREYDEAWQTGSRFADLRRELLDTRAELRALVRELKTAREHGPAICKALRATVADMRREMRAAYKAAENLKDSVWREYHAAFNDGAGETVFK